MGRKEKLIKKLLSRAGEFRFSELSVLLSYLGYREIKKGKTSGSRRAFYSESENHIIRLHKPHHKEILKKYQVNYIIQELKKKGMI